MKYILWFPGSWDNDVYVYENIKELLSHWEYNSIEDFSSDIKDFIIFKCTIFIDNSEYFKKESVKNV